MLEHRLRTKVEAEPTRPMHLLTMFGEGYRFEQTHTALQAGFTHPDSAPGLETAALRMALSASGCSA